jgi:hypothetical protein
VNGGNTTAKSPKGLTGATEQSTNSRTHRVHNKIAIIAIQQKNETESGMVGMQAAQSFKQEIVIGWPVAQKQDIDGNRPQSLQAIGKLAVTASNPQAGLTPKGAAQ